jgi:hypothetical protein
LLSSYQAQIIEQRQLYGKPVVIEEEEDVETITRKEREELVKQYSKYDAFRIAIQIDGNWQESQQQQQQLFKYHKITSADHRQASELAEQLREADDDEHAEITVEPSPEKYEVGEKQDDELAKITKIIDYYRFLAFHYLEMSSEQFDRCDWGKLRLVVDACNYRTNHTLVEDSMGLYEFFHLEDTRGNPIVRHLTDRDHALLRMFRLWTGKAKLKPWHINGGIIYEEDINSFLQLEALQISGMKLKEKKSKWKQDHANVGPDGEVHKHTTKVRNHR